MTTRDLRAEAVTAVDQRHGHTIFACPDPFAHRVAYDDEEARLNGQVVCAVHGHQSEDAGDGTTVCVRCGITSRPCSYCKNGSKTGPNGEWQRCVMCGGTGRLLDSDPASGTP